jgi:circadian clock protein KaiB
VSTKRHKDTISDKGDSYVFNLFIAGMSVKSIDAIENLRFICEKYLPGKFEIEIIDIHQQGHLAVQYGIIATPTLIKLGPLPRKTVLGDLSDKQKVLKLLDIK